MKPASFLYRAPRSLDEAVALLAEHGDEAKVLAGGQSLVPLMNFRLAQPAVLVDLNGVPGLDGIEAVTGLAGGKGDGADEAGRMLRIGALVRHHRLEYRVDDGPLGRLLATVAHNVGHLPIRMRGTFGGSIAHADPAAEWCVLASLLDAQIEAVGPGASRTIPAAEFFDSTFTTTLGPDEVLTAVRLPLLASGTGIGFREFSRRAGDFAIIAAAATVDTTDDGIVRRVRLALGGVAGRPVRTVAAERLLVGLALDSSVVTEAGEVAAGEVDPPSDVHGSAEYRRDLVRAMVRRALTDAWRGRN
jgi:carbon-monoxide dehydrogenase medium subunit